MNISLLSDPLSYTDCLDSVTYGISQLNIEDTPDWYPTRSSSARKPSLITQEIRRALLQGKKIELSLEQLIASVLSNQGIDATHAEQSLRIAHRWVHNASQHIFSERFQCIAELIRNGIDSCVPPDECVGQFGLGFFSAFALLTEEGHALTVATRHQDLCYEITITKTQNGFLCRFEPVAYHGLFTEHTGTLITFPRACAKDIRQYAHFFDFMSPPLVYFDKYAPIERYQASVVVDTAYVRDQGRGLSLEDAIENMLVPGCTSKPAPIGISEPRAGSVSVRRWLGKIDEGSGSYLLFVVSKTIAMKRRLRTPLDDGLDLVIELPRGVRHITSRDEILFGEDGKSFEEQCLFRTIDRMVEKVVQGADEPILIEATYRALREWEETTAAVHLGTRFSSHLRSCVREHIARNPKLIPVPKAHWNELKQILAKAMDDVRLLPIDPSFVEYSFQRLYVFVCDFFEKKQAIDRSLIEGMQVIFVDDAYLPKTAQGCSIISSLGMLNILFAPQSMKQMTSSAQSLTRKLIFDYAGRGNMRLRPPKSKEELPFVAPYLKKLQWAVNHQRSLEKAYPKVVLLQSIVDLLTELAMIRARARASFRPRILALIQSVCYMNNELLDVPDSQIPYTYGSPSTEIPHTLSTREMHMFKHLLDLPEHLATKLVTFIIDHNALIMQRRYDNVQTYSADYGPMALIGGLMIHKMQVVAQLILENAHNAIDVIYLGHLFDRRDLWRGKRVDLLRADLDYFIKQYVFGSISYAERCAWYDEFQKCSGSPREPEIHHILHQFVQDSGKMSDMLFRTTHFIPPTLKFQLDHTMPFTLNQLIQSCFQKDRRFFKALEMSNHEQALGIICKQERHFPLRKIAAGVTHSSEQSACTSIFIECLQNSVDAIRAFAQQHAFGICREKWNSVDFKVEMVGENSVAVEICDYIGIKDLSTLFIDMLVPDYSQKSKEENVGQMGNGMQKLYKNARMVTIETCLENGQGYFLSITPHARHGVVEDLTCRLIRQQAPQPGTRIRVLFWPKAAQDALRDARSALMFLQETLTCCPFSRVAEKPLKLLLLAEHGGRLLLNRFERGEGTLYTSSKVAGLSVEDNHSDSQSYVTTGGIPFIPLTAFCVQYRLLPKNIERFLSSGYTLELPPCAYEPVQSRTKVKLQFGVVQEIQTALLDACYLRSCQESCHSSEALFLHGTSTASFDQVKISRYGWVEEQERIIAERGDDVDWQMWMTYHEVSNLHGTAPKSFAHFVELEYPIAMRITSTIKTYQHLLDEILVRPQSDDTPPQERCAQVLSLCKATEAQIETMFREWEKGLKERYPASDTLFKTWKMALLGWMWNKRFGGMKRYAKEKDVMEDLACFAPCALAVSTEAHAIDLGRGALRAVIYSTLASYCTHIFQGNGLQTEVPTVKMTYEPLSGVLGSYNKASNEISIDIKYFNVKDVLHALSALLQDDIATAQSAMQGIFIPLYGNSGTLLHELEHARKKQQCLDGHGKCMSVLEKVVNFNAAASSMYALAARNGAISRWLEDVCVQLEREFGKDKNRIIQDLLRDVSMWYEKGEDAFCRWFLTSD